MTTPPEADALYALPLEQFTAARNALAKELAGRGQREQSDVVRRLTKPTRTAWALNQLARRRPDDVRRLLETGERFRQAQAAALDGDASELRATAREEQALVEELLAAAVEVLAPSAAARTSAEERLRRTLRAAALDPETGSRLRDGCLVGDVETAGFGLLSFDEGDAAKSTPRDAEGDRGHAEERRQAAREAAHLRKEAERAVARARRLWDQVERAERRAAEARADADAAAEVAAAAQREADEALARAGLAQGPGE